MQERICAMYRDNTNVVKIGNKNIGGGNPILIQSMTNTRTEDIVSTVKQIKDLEAVGCDIIRCTVPTMEAAAAIKEIKKQINIPLVADIHFDYRMAIAAMENGADKIRINPGNIGSIQNIKAVVDVAKQRGKQRDAGNENEAHWDVWSSNDVAYQSKYHPELIADFIIKNP